MFTISEYSQLCEGSKEDNYSGKGVFSYATGRLISLTDAALQLIKEKRFRDLSGATQLELLANEIIKPADVDEIAVQGMRLSVFEKITVIVRSDISTLDFRLLYSYVTEKNIGTLYFIFLNPADTGTLHRNILFLNSRMRPDDPVVKVIRIFTLVEAEKPFKSLNLNEVTLKGDSIESEEIHQQLILGWQDKIESILSDAFQQSKKRMGISLFCKSADLRMPYNSKVNCIRNELQASTVFSEYPYAKELPFAGLIIDSENIPRLSEITLQPKCVNCKLLAACGGYSGKTEVNCPSYKSWSNLVEFHRVRNMAAEPAPVNKSSGVSNALTLNADITRLFDKAIQDNVPPEGILLINYLNHEYSKGFQYSQRSLNNIARFIFEQADQIVETIDPASFLYKWIQTFATSTKSYLAYKGGGFEKAIAITQEGIDNAIRLQAYPSSGVMTLFVAQMLLNKAKVFLVAGKYVSWQITMLENIQYLVNFEIPAGCEAINIQQLKNIDPALRYWLFQECISQVIKFNLTNKNLEHGNQIIHNIKIDEQKTLFDKQLSLWVSLNIATEENDTSYIARYFEEFLSAKNSSVNIASLQTYIRTKAKKLVRSADNVI